MAVTWRESLKRFGPVVVISDPYTIKDWETAIGDMFATQVMPAQLSVLIDGRHCQPPPTSFVTRALTVLGNHTRLAGQRIAVVVDSDASYGLGRLAEATVEVRKLPFAFRTFRDWAEAERWLADAAARNMNE